MDRRSFPSKKLARLKKVEINLKDRIESLSYYHSSNKNPSIITAKTAKRFRKGLTINPETMLSYRQYLQSQLAIVQSNILKLEEGLR